MILEITKEELLKRLAENNWVKLHTAIKLGTSEASIRRACIKYGISTSFELESSLGEVGILNVASPSGSYTPNREAVLVIPDLHSVYCDWRYLDLICKFIADFKPSIIIQIGDLADYECLMGKVKQKYPSFDSDDILSLAKEFKAVQRILSSIHAVTPPSVEKYHLCGNHEFRCDLLLRKQPNFAGQITLAKRVDMEGWRQLGYLEPLKIGKLNFIHGEFYGRNHVTKHLQHYQKNVMYGHTHDIAMDSLSSPMREIPIWGASIGCGCNLNPDYQRNKSSKWQLGFAYGWIDSKTGDFFMIPQRIINYQFIADGGKRYKA